MLNRINTWSKREKCKWPFFWFCFVFLIKWKCLSSLKKDLNKHLYQSYTSMQEQSGNLVAHLPCWVTSVCTGVSIKVVSECISDSL